jgi:hypothetical protein
MLTCMLTFTYTQEAMCLHIYTYIQYTHTHTYTYIYIYIHTHTIQEPPAPSSPTRVSKTCSSATHTNNRTPSATTQSQHPTLSSASQQIRSLSASEASSSLETKGGQGPGTRVPNRDGMPEIPEETTPGNPVPERDGAGEFVAARAVSTHTADAGHEYASRKPSAADLTSEIWMDSHAKNGTGLSVSGLSHGACVQEAKAHQHDHHHHHHHPSGHADNQGIERVRSVSIVDKNTGRPHSGAASVRSSEATSVAERRTGSRSRLVPIFLCANTCAWTHTYVCDTRNVCAYIRTHTHTYIHRCIYMYVCIDAR